MPKKKRRKRVKRNKKLENAADENTKLDENQSDDEEAAGQKSKAATEGKDTPVIQDEEIEEVDEEFEAELADFERRLNQPLKLYMPKLPQQVVETKGQEIQTQKQP